jgi:hypothetical protein
MTQAPDTLTNIAMSFAGELAAREERLRAEQTLGLNRIADLIQAGFDGIRKDMGGIRKDMDGIRNDIAELKASDRELLSGLQNLQGQVTAMQRSGKA